MGLGERGKHRIEGYGLKVEVRPAGRPKGEAVKVKSFALPVGLNQRLRRFAFEQERSEVDVVRAALEAYLDAQEGK